MFRWAAITLPKALAAVIETSGVGIEDIEVFIPHQANARINELMKKNLGFPDDLPMQRHREHRQHLAASIPLAMEEMLATGKARGGQTAMLLGFGAGLSYAGAIVTLPRAGDHEFRRPRLRPAAELFRSRVANSLRGNEID